MRDRQTITPEECAARIRGAGNLVALTGAGISTAAGIPDFRGPQGLYVTRRYDPDTVFDIGAFLRDPAPFFEFTRDFLGVIDEIQPTRTHRLLARLERDGLLNGVITQNIDFLHQRAGSRRVVAVHGGYWTSRCLDCGAAYRLDELQGKLVEQEIPRCHCAGLIKPDVVFFGEPVHELGRAAELVAASDLLLVLGSSLVVYPVAFLPESAKGEVVVVNSGPVGLAPSGGRFFADADLDEYFAEVERFLYPSV